MLASGMAIGLGRIVERLTPAGMDIQAAEARPILATPRVADRWYDEPEVAADTRLAYVFDGVLPRGLPN
jgi:hypothetical protein